MNRSLIEEFETSSPHLLQLKDIMEGRLRRLVGDAGLMIHSLGGRVKARSSLERKLARPDRSYQHLFEITDLLAFRVVTYSEDLISEVARQIENAFDVDFENSVNKLHHEDSQKFGYRSLHYVCALPLELSEQLPAAAAPFKFEVQIRTILQHAWAEIEHDIGYKTTEQLPRDFRRRFSQIASLLEVADREFASIRTDLREYEIKLKTMDFREEQVELEHLSLQSILHSEEVAALDHKVSVFIGAPVSDEVFYPDYILRVVRAAGLKRVGDVLKKASSLRKTLSSFLPVYFDFAKSHWEFDKYTIQQVQKGYGLLFLAHLHIIEEEDLLIDKVNRLTRFYSEIDYPDDFKSAKSAAQSLVTALKLNRLIQE